MGIEILYTDNKNIDFSKLISFLDEDLNKRYGELQKQYDKHNNVEDINNVILVYTGEFPIACGAFKEYDSSTIELKRIFVLNKHRGKGLAKLIVNKLEETAKKKNYKYAILETGKKQLEAINLYKGLGYKIIPNYGAYIKNTNSLCMKKCL